jgi:hypothetical protein
MKNGPTPGDVYMSLAIEEASKLGALIFKERLRSNTRTFRSILETVRPYVVHSHHSKPWHTHTR